ncbi:MAG TPA: alpha-L-arabinofuranosidase C-terminal domain-containing protein, partial [Chryseolinea sp.]|nr:alpha-L-arabinofuranosidase C-terminal domain-containing protein [Chryseolinea sp.]
GVIHISLVNIDAKNEQEITVDLRGGKYSGVTGKILASSKLQDHNTFEAPDKIKPANFTGVKLTGGVLKGKLPPFSVVVLELR